MQDAMKGYLEEPEDGKKRELLADEADFVLLDSYRPLQRTEEMSEKEMERTINQRRIAYRLLENVKKKMPEGLFVKDDSSQYVDFTKEGREKIVEEINTHYKNDKRDLNSLYDYVYDALVVDTVYKENRDYQILNDGHKIVSEDRASGVGIDLPEGVRQALEIKLIKEGKYFGEISPERKVVDTLNTQSFFKKFFNGSKHFVSGTLGVDSKAIVEELKNFGVSKDEGDIYEAPPKEKRSRDDRKKRFLRNPTKKRKEVIKTALEEIKQGRPVLVGTVSEEEINKLKETLGEQEETSNIRILEFTAASEEIYKQDIEKLNSFEFKAKYGVDKKQYKDYKSLIKNESGKENTITFGTSILGRGTTIKTSKDINAKGGIHVIIDGLHETSSRNQEQYKARTARGDNNGSTQEFFCEEDIPEELRGEKLTGGADEIYKKIYESIDARTSGIRNYVVQFVEKTVEKLSEIDEIEGMSPELKNQAKALLTQRAFSIKNRACGVSDKFQTNIAEYEKEIDAYAELYVAKYMVTDERYYTGARFDESKWLEENGYKDLAQIHMPFNDKRENEIFKTSGIKPGKIKREAIQESQHKKIESMPNIPKTKKASKTNSKVVQKISDNEVAGVFSQAVEMIVDESFKTRNKVEVVRSVRDVGEPKINKIPGENPIPPITQVAKSVMTVGGIKQMIKEPKNRENIRSNRITHMLSTFKESLLQFGHVSLEQNAEKAKAVDEYEDYTN